MKKYKTYSRNEIIEAMTLLELLQKEGIDIALIPKSTKGKKVLLKDINIPQEILLRYDLKGDTDVGEKINIIVNIYKENLMDENIKQRIKKLGVIKTNEEIVQETINILHLLNNNGIRINFIQSNVVQKDGIKRDKLLYEIGDKKINTVIKKLGLPKYLEIEKRIDKAKSYVRRAGSQDKIEYIKNELIKLGILKKENINISKTLEVLKELESRGINTAKIKTVKEGSDEKIRLKDLQLNDLESLLEKLGINEDFPLGKGITKIISIYSDKSYLTKKNISEQEKIEIEKFTLKKATLGKNKINETIELIEKLVGYGIDFSVLYLKTCKEGVQELLRLGDLPLTEEQFEKIKKEFGLNKNCNLGSRIATLRKIAKNERNPILTKKQIQMLEQFKVIGKRQKGKRPEELALQKIMILEELVKEGINFDTFSPYYYQKGRKRLKKLQMINIENATIRKICEKFKVTPEFGIGSCYLIIKEKYRKDVLSDNMAAKVERLGIITDLDKEARTQEKLKKKLDEAIKLEQQVQEKIENTVKRDEDNEK